MLFKLQDLVTCHRELLKLSLADRIRVESGGEFGASVSDWEGRLGVWFDGVTSLSRALRGR